MAASTSKTTNPSQTNFDALDRLSSSTLKRNPKMELSKSDLLKLLTYLEGELQAREIVIATLKAERVKQLLYQAKYGQFSLNDPFAALQRDSYGAYNPNCDEASIKAMYNNQLSQVENLILQHRRAQQRLRQHLYDAGAQHAKVVGDLEEEIRKHAQDTAQGDDVTYMLEKERERLHQEVELERQQNKKLERELKKVVQALEQDKVRHKQIVVLLLEDRKRIISKLLDEHSKNEEMTQFLTMEKGRMADVVDGLEEESKKSLLMEAELEQQAAEFAIEREQLSRMLERKCDENRRLQDQLASLEREAAAATSTATVTNAGQQQHHHHRLNNEDDDDIKLYGELSPKQLTVARPSKSPSPIPPSSGGGSNTVIPPQQHSSTLIIGTSPGPLSPVSAGGSVSPLPMQSSTIVRNVRAVPAAAAAAAAPPSPNTTNAQHVAPSHQHHHHNNNSSNNEKSIVRSVVSAITGATTTSLPAPPSTAPPPPPSTPPSIANNTSSANTPRVSVSASPGTRVYTTTQGGKVTFHVTAPPQPPKKPPLLAATVAAATSAASGGMGRGTPPPVPPNKPVLPKKEPGFAQHVLSGGSSSSGVVGGSSISSGGTVMTICSSAAVSPATTITSSSTGPVKIAASPMPGGGVKFGITISKSGDSLGGSSCSPSLSSSSSASHLVLSSAPNSAGGGATVVAASSAGPVSASGSSPQVQQIFKETQCGSSQPVIVTAISSPCYEDTGESYIRPRYLAFSGNDVETTPEFGTSRHAFYHSSAADNADESLCARTADELAPEIADFQQLLQSMAATSQPSSVVSDHPITMTHQHPGWPLGGAVSSANASSAATATASDSGDANGLPTIDLSRRSGSPMGRLSAMLEQWKLERGMSTVTTTTTVTSSFSCATVVTNAADDEDNEDETSSSLLATNENGSSTVSGSAGIKRNNKVTKNCSDQQKSTDSVGGRRPTTTNFNPRVRKVVSPTLPKSFNDMKL